mmetsp:Transcript_36900/g.82440  ORF Transcript_36900/g.82440 Transcript_36900/m.82440 type:complete len:97 (+) Transcript_36900:734-1024(+)
MGKRPYNEPALAVFETRWKRRGTRFDYKRWLKAFHSWRAGEQAFLAHKPWRAPSASAKQALRCSKRQGEECSHASSGGRKLLRCLQFFRVHLSQPV